MARSSHESPIKSPTKPNIIKLSIGPIKPTPTHHIKPHHITSHHTTQKDPEVEAVEAFARVLNEGRIHEYLDGEGWVEGVKGG